MPRLSMHLCTIKTHNVGSKSKGGMLALDMGMGKTPVMLAVRIIQPTVLQQDKPRLDVFAQYP